MERHSTRTYRVLRKLDDGQEVFVASLGDYVEARALIESLKEYWPGDYSILPSASIKPDIPPQAACVQFR
jgi:hypothetical protein